VKMRTGFKWLTIIPNKGIDGGDNNQDELNLNTEYFIKE
jgi:hypothetical protein